MAILSIALTPRERFELSDSGVLTSHHLAYEGHRHILPVPPSAGLPTQLATSDEHLFALTANGEVWRMHAGSQDNWHKIPSPLGVTFIATTQDSLQFLHSSGSAISSAKLPADNFLEISDVAGLTGIVGFAGDEAMRVIWTSGANYVQSYGRGSPEFIPSPPDTVEIEIGEEFIYFLDASGEIYRSREYELSGFEKLDGVTGASTFAVRSDHVDDLYIATGNGVIVVSPDTWDAGVSTFSDGWITSDWVSSDWIDVA